VGEILLYFASLCLTELFKNLPRDHTSPEKRLISTPEFRDITTKGRLELI
jgi:hypothetical protein